MGVGVHFKLYLADYFAYLNNKMGGDIDNIRTVGKYFVEVWRAAGVDTDKVEIVWCKDLMSDPAYWERVLKIGKALTLDRVKRAITIMGRKEGEEENVYPPIVLSCYAGNGHIPDGHRHMPAGDRPEKSKHNRKGSCTQSMVGRCP